MKTKSFILLGVAVIIVCAVVSFSVKAELNNGKSDLLKANIEALADDPNMGEISWNPDLGIYPCHRYFFGTEDLEKCKQYLYCWEHLCYYVVAQVVGYSNTCDSIVP